VKGRKRHLLVDTNGFLLHVLVHEANIQDHNGGKLLLEPLQDCFPRLKLIWADSGYKKGGFVQWVKAIFGWEVEIVEHPWSGIRSVWVPEGVEVDWEKILCWLLGISVPKQASKELCGKPCRDVDK
jgi:putative transposase